MSTEQFDEACVRCGHPVHEVAANGWNAGMPEVRRVLLHTETGMIHCPNLSGTIACLPNGGVE